LTKHRAPESYEAREFPVPMEQKKRALVVDDEQWVRAFVREVLESESFEVVEAENGKVAARFLQSSTAIALIVTDILMPEEDGVEFIREAKRIPFEPRPKILAISGGGIFAKPELFLNIADSLGADISLAKPFTDVNLKEALRLLGLARPRIEIAG
jgi:CheY-like chemotaxis protein